MSRILKLFYIQSSLIIFHLYFGQCWCPSSFRELLKWHFFVQSVFVLHPDIVLTFVTSLIYCLKIVTCKHWARTEPIFMEISYNQKISCLNVFKNFLLLLNFFSIMKYLKKFPENRLIKPFVKLFRLSPFSSSWILA